MTDRPDERSRLREDLTRDITLPPLPDRPGPALPKEWAALRLEQTEAPRTEAPASEGRDGLTSEGRDAPVPDVPRPTTGTGDFDTPTLRAHPGEDPRLHDQPTDKVGSPRLRVRPPDRTLAFSAPEMTHRPVDPVQVGRAPRRWPWVLLTVLPILVIAGAGIALLLLLRG